MWSYLWAISGTPTHSALSGRSLQSLCLAGSNSLLLGQGVYGVGRQRVAWLAEAGSAMD